MATAGEARHGAGGGMSTVVTRRRPAQAPPVTVAKTYPAPTRKKSRPPIRPSPRAVAFKRRPPRVPRGMIELSYLGRRSVCVWARGCSWDLIFVPLYRYGVLTVAYLRRRIIQFHCMDSRHCIFSLYLIEQSDEVNLYKVARRRHNEHIEHPTSARCSY